MRLEEQGDQQEGLRGRSCLRVRDQPKGGGVMEGVPEPRVDRGGQLSEVK